MIRSPFFYVGDKYKISQQLLNYFPKDIKTYVEPFYGGGSSQLQVEAESYVLNDIDSNVIRLHKFLLREMKDTDAFFNHLFSLIEHYKLSCSYLSNVIPKQLKAEYPKTYYSKYNKVAYSVLKDDFNRENQIDDYKLYLLLVYGFNHMIRFNSKGLFNLPVGNVDFNKNVFESLNNYNCKQRNRKIEFSNQNFKQFIESLKLDSSDFIYCDPPYLISMSEYNKLWNEDMDMQLYALLDSLSSKGVHFGITNLLCHKGKTNLLFKHWSKKYKIEPIVSNYISFNDNTIKNDSIELYVHN